MVKQLGVKSFCQSISGSTSLLWFQWYSAESTQQERNKNGTLNKSWKTRNCVNLLLMQLNVHLKPFQFELRKFMLRVSAHPYCTQNSHTMCTEHTTSSKLSNRAIGKMAIAKTLCVFNDLGRSVTPIFHLMGRFSYYFLCYAKKMKKIYWVKVWIFCKMLHQIPFIWHLHLALRQFEIPL